MDQSVWRRLRGRSDRRNPTGGSASDGSASGDSASRSGEHAAHGEHAASKPPQNAAWRWAKEIVIVVVIALALSLVVKTFFFRAFFIPSSSMENTLLINDRVFVNLIGPSFTGYQRGDIVVFKDTQGWLPAEQQHASNPAENVLVFLGLAPDPSQEYLVKRVIGLPGDHVQCCDPQGRVIINGQPVDEPYALPGGALPFDVVVPADEFWVMGDNRPNSADSRLHPNAPLKGFIARKDVVGVASVIAWPLDRIRGLNNGVLSQVPGPKP
ncbi:signal peptidase I [Psychromicrobium xiongbiense]|uniref:signal peptidase I n=1 Tax=Psychromicrobium xiongbiense TaxID=3051184 RepID=UPI002554862E|nr:signal peptidase I [Psychromicrobium sp. YIM S02556]